MLYKYITEFLYQWLSTNIKKIKKCHQSATTFSKERELWGEVLH